MELVNSINKKAVLGAQSKMRAEKGFAAAAPTHIDAIWNANGIVTNPVFSTLQARGMLTSADSDVPSVLGYCPLTFATCYSFVFMLIAAEKDMQLESYECEVDTVADLSCFFTGKGPVPWENGVKLVLKVKGNHPFDKVKEVAQQAKLQCPSVAILEQAYPLQVVVNSKQVGDTFNCESPYDMESYHAGLSSPISQSAVAKWYCHNECTEFPDAFMVLTANDGSKVPVANEAPIGPGIYPNPVQACLFGATALHMHTLATKLFDKGYKIQSLEGAFDTKVNKRRVMGVDPLEAEAFPGGGGVMTIDLASTAPDDVVQSIAKDLESSSPAYLGMVNPVNVELSIKEVE